MSSPPVSAFGRQHLEDYEANVVCRRPVWKPPRAVLYIIVTITIISITNIIIIITITQTSSWKCSSNGGRPGETSGEGLVSLRI